MFSYPASAGGIATRIIQGGRQGPVVLLLHGLSARADRWRLNVDALGAAGMRAMAVDLPGHGFAAKGGGFSHTAAGYSAWLEQLVAGLGRDGQPVERVVLIGTSFGGLVAASYAADHPHRVAGLMAVGAIGLVPAGLERRERTIKWLGEMRREQIRERLYRGVLDSALITEDLIDEDFHINNSPGAAQSFAALAHYYRDGLDDDAAAPRLARAAQRHPVSLVWGSQDPSVAPAYGEQAHAIMQGSTLTMVDGCGHFPYWEKPEAFNRLAIDFVRQCAGLERPATP